MVDRPFSPRFSRAGWLVAAALLVAVMWLSLAFATGRTATGAHRLYITAARGHVSVSDAEARPVTTVSSGRLHVYVGHESSRLTLSCGPDFSAIVLGGQSETEWSGRLEPGTVCNVAARFADSRSGGWRFISR